MRYDEVVLPREDRDLTEATNTASSLYVSEMWFICKFLVFDFMQYTAAIRSNDNLDCTECTRLCRRDIKFIVLPREDHKF